MSGRTNGSSRRLAALFVLLTGLLAARNVASWPVRLRYPADTNHGEGMLLAEVVHLRRGIRIYAPASAERYDAANWGPLFYLLGARLVDPQEPAYWPLRVVSLLGTLGCAAGCGLLAFWFGRSKLAGALAPLLFLSYGFVTRQGISARSEMVALLLCFVGFLIAYRFRQTRGLLLGVPLMLLGFYYKQQFVAGPAAVLLFLVLERRYRLAAEFAGLLALGGVGLLLYFQYVVFAGQAFLHHFVFYNILPFTDLGYGVAFFLVFLLVPFSIGVQALRVRPDKLLACNLGSSVCLGLLTSPRAGADSYYFYEILLMVSVLVPGLIAKTIAESSRVFWLFLFFCISLLTAHLSPPPPRQADFEQDRVLQDYLKKHFAPQTPALAYYSGELVRAGLDTPITNIFHYSALVRKGTFSDQDLVAQIGRHRFGLVVLNFDLQPGRDDFWANFYLTRPVREAILGNYRLADVLEVPGPSRFRPEDLFYVWVPPN